MAVYYRAAFDQARCCIDPDEINLSPKAPALPAWAGLVVAGAMAGWGVPRYVADDNDEDTAAIAGYEDRTRLALELAIERRLVDADVIALAMTVRST